MRVAPAVALAVLVAACTPTLPSPPPSRSDASIAPTPAPTVSAAPTSELVGWRKVATTDAMGNGPAAVAWFKDRWVAVGVDRSRSQWRPLAWWSSDGVTWTPGSLGTVPAGKVSSAFVGLAVYGDVLVAYGWSSSALRSSAMVDLAGADGGPRTGNVVAAVARPTRDLSRARNADLICFPTLGSADALVMTSTDGATWATVPNSAALHGQPMLGIATVNGALVAVGGADGSRHSAAWTSSDGQRWTRAPDSAALRSGAMQGVINVGGTLVAWGFSIDQEVCPAPLLWRSTDGIAWTKVADAVGRQSLWRSVSTAATSTVGLTVVGSTSTRALDLTTSDGLTWTAHDLPDDLAYGPVVAVPDGFLAAGEQALWFSPDGAAWTVRARPGVQFELLAVGPGATIGMAAATDAGTDPFVNGTDIWLGPAAGN